MTLADKIVAERKKRGWSQEELAERVDVTRQSVSKWEGGLSVPDLDKIVQLARLFGVSCDYLLCGESEPATENNILAAETAPQENAEEKRELTQAEGDAYLAARVHAAPRIALGVLLCILGAVAVVLFTALADDVLPELTAILTGLGLLLILVAVGVALFIASGLRLSAYKYMEEEPFALPTAFRASLRAEQEAHRPRYITHMIIGVVLCILSVAPLLITIVLADERTRLYGLWIAGGVVGLLVIVACGVFLIVRACMRFGGYAVLLQEGEYAEVRKAAKKKSEAILGFFWLAVLAGYLVYSYSTEDWDTTWIIWPIAAIVSGVIEQIFLLVNKTK